MFQKIFVERHLWDQSNVVWYSRSKKILTFFKQEPILIDKVEDYFGRVKKPYLQKRNALNLYIGEKRGKLVKETPPAYGYEDEKKHFYFIYSYNCIYECEYCYLQSYFSSPDIVFFINYEAIITAMEEILHRYPNQEIWFHGGEFSDSLALSRLTQEWKIFWDFFRDHPQANLELRTKSVYLDQILELPSYRNIVISFSINPSAMVREFDRKTPSLKARMRAMAQLLEKNYFLGIHLDPIIYTCDFKVVYLELVQSLSNLFQNRMNQLSYVSLGTLRFAKGALEDMRSNYPESRLGLQESVVGFDHKMRYPRPHRMWMLKWLKKKFCEEGFEEKKLYYCMESLDQERRGVSC